MQVVRATFFPEDEFMQTVWKGGESEGEGAGGAVAAVGDAAEGSGPSAGAGGLGDDMD